MARLLPLTLLFLSLALPHHQVLSTAIPSSPSLSERYTTPLLSAPYILQDGATEEDVQQHQKRWDDLAGRPSGVKKREADFLYVSGELEKRGEGGFGSDLFAEGGVGGLVEIVQLSGQQGDEVIAANGVGERGFELVDYDEEGDLEKREAMRTPLRTPLSRTTVSQAQQLVTSSATPTTTMTTTLTSQTTTYTQTTLTTTITTTPSPTPTTTSTPISTSTKSSTSTKKSSSSSTKKTTTSTSTTAKATATTSSSATTSLGYTSSGLNLDATHSGDGTYFDVGLGACGTTAKNTDYIVAVSYLLYETFPGHTANPNNNPICGKKLAVTYGGKTIQVVVQDECMGCENPWSLDFSPTAFAQLADLDVGRLTGVSWVFLD